MYDVLTVADAILKIAKSKGVSLTPMQLMKLVYIAHGWSLGLRGIDLFRNRIEAWQYGPVMPDLYHATKQFGRNPIPLHMVGEGPPPVSMEDVDFLTDVFDKYGHLSGPQLSYLTHQSGTPWILCIIQNSAELRFRTTLSVVIIRTSCVAGGL